MTPYELPGYFAVVTSRLRSAKSNSCGSLWTSVAEPLTFATDLGQFIELCIHRPWQTDPANHIAVDQGRKTRCQQSRAHAVKVLLKIAKSLRPKQKLSDDQQRPTLANELRSTGKRAKLG